MTSRRENWIDWRNSEARAIVLGDLFSGVLPVDENQVSAEEAWEYYQHLPEFVGPRVQFDQFVERLADHRDQVRAREDRSQWEMAAMAHDRLLNPYEAHNHRGEVNFYLSQAMNLLRQDVDNGLHTQMGPAGLRNSRAAYKQFKHRKFKDLINQTVRRKKLENWLASRGRVDF